MEWQCAVLIARLQQERGWQMFASWVTHCMTDVGFSSLHDVMQVPAQHTDSMESYAFAETFKCVWGACGCCCWTQR